VPPRSVQQAGDPAAEGLGAAAGRLGDAARVVSCQFSVASCQCRDVTDG
jgi:hypothetical protein